MIRRISFWAAATAVAVSTAVGAHASVLRLRWPEDARAERGLIILRDPAALRENVTIPVEAGNEIVPLPDGQWIVSAAFDGLWSDVVVAGTRSETLLTLLPAGHVTGRVELPARRKASTLRLYFQVSNLEAGSAPARGSTVCDVRESSVDCPVPAGVYDLTFRIDGYASLQRWEVAIPRLKRVDTGTLSFTEGSTLSGSVIAEERGFDPTKASIFVTPSTAPNENEELRRRLQSGTIVVRPNRRGRFAVNLGAGSYTLTARAAKLTSEERTVIVYDGQESVLRQPLELLPPGTLSVAVRPARDPLGSAWAIQLARLDETRAVVSSRRMAPDLSGLARFEGIVPGHYEVSVLHRGGQIWATSTLDVRGDTTVDLSIPVVKVSGGVRRGERPIAAVLDFYADVSGVHARAGTASDGTFVAALPQPPGDKWDRIEVLAQGGVRSILRDIHIHCREDATADLLVELPDTRLEGIVVDGEDVPAGPALIDVTDDLGFVQQYETRDGRFAISGLSLGRYTLKARTREAESRLATEANLRAEEPRVTGMRIVVGASAKFRGAVVSASGPQPSARMFVAPAGDYGTPLILNPVGPRGEFEIALRPGTRDVVVVVQTPGFSSRFTRSRPSEEGTVIAVDQVGGALMIDQPRSRGERRPYIIHDGAVLPALQLAYLAGGRFLETPGEKLNVEIPSIEPGSYTLCWASAVEAATTMIAPEACTTGVLQPNGELAFRDACRTSD